MNGILCIDKPAGFTSFDVVAKMRGILRTRKLGHAGTLDPMATGVLVLLAGNATKACDILPNQDKCYLATIRLGVTTDTQDSTGTVLARRTVHATKEDVQRVLPDFTGAQMQVPPMFSALWVDGKRLYELARKGVEIPREGREIEISTLELHSASEAEHEYTLQIFCSKGTYVRTLAHDIGQKLGCGAMMTALRRTVSCGYTLDDCMTFEQAQRYRAEGTLETKLRSVESAFSSFHRLDLTEKQYKYFCGGITLSLARMELVDVPDGTGFSIYSPAGAFFAVARANPAEDELLPFRWFAPPSA